MRRLLIPVALVLMAACSSGADDETTVTESSDTLPATIEVERDGSADSAATVPDGDTSTTAAAITTPADAVADSTTTTPTPTSTTTVAPVEPLINDATLIPTLTPPVVEMLRPVLEWEPIEGADSYSVVVLDEAGEPYWAWSGTESEIVLGGAPSSDFGIGPIIGVDYSWSVAAFDADGVFLAISGEVPISTE